jgi:hypothetical protein
MIFFDCRGSEFATISHALNWSYIGFCVEIPAFHHNPGMFAGMSIPCHPECEKLLVDLHPALIAFLSYGATFSL